MGGFLDGLRIDFGDGLNCIVGGRGTGKTTLLELARYALDLMPDPKRQASRFRRIQRLVKTNLGTGKIRLTIETKHGVRYTVERAANEPPRVIDDAGAAKEFSLAQDLVFRANVYSRSEILSIAGSARAQLDLIDRFAAEDVRRVGAEIDKLLVRLEENAVDLVRLDREIGGLRDVTAEAQGLAERLKGLEERDGPDAKRLNAAHAAKARRDREREAVEALRRDLPRASTEIEAAIGSTLTRLGSRVAPDLVGGPDERLLAEVSNTVKTLSTALREDLRVLRERIAHSGRELTGHFEALGRSHAAQEADYRTLVSSSDEAHARAAERNAVQERHAQVTTAQRELDTRLRERDVLVTNRQALLERLSTLRDERFRLRKSVAIRLTRGLTGEVRVSVQQAASNTAYLALLKKALKGKGLRTGDIVSRLMKSVSPDELSSLVRSEDADQLARRVGIRRERARKVIDRLQHTIHLYRIEAVELEDRPRLSLRDGEEFKDAKNLSTGQRCTTILAIMLLEDETVLLVDQPENELDNAFVYDKIVPLLEKITGRRQLIFVTHNANIPVVGKAERVFVLQSNGSQATLKAAGTVDELREDIEKILEGGPKAFLYRKERYGH